MRVVIFGASGMVGQGVLWVCLHDPEVTEVRVVGRTPLEQTDPKLRELVVPDVGNLTAVEGELGDYDACFWCLGVASAGKTEQEYRRVTYDLTISAGTALARINPGMTFVYVSGAGTDSTEHGRAMWARVKGATENALLRLPFKAFMFRPGIIQPQHGIRSKTRSYRLLYAILWPLIFPLRAIAPNSVTCTDRVGRAMIAVARHPPADRIVEMKELNALGAQ